MRTKHALLLSLVAIVSVLQLGSAWGAPERASRARWDEVVEPRASKVVLHNLGALTAEASLGAAALSLAPGGFAEVPAVPSGAGPLHLRSDAALLVLQASDGFDSGSLVVEEKAAAGIGAVADGTVRHGATGSATVTSKSAEARVEVAVELLAPHTSVRVRQLDRFGNEVTALVAFSPRPVRWRATLGPVDGETRIELQTLRGESRGTAAAAGPGLRPRRSRLVPLQNKSGGGNGSFDPEINWENSPPLYYHVTGGPPNLCGDLYTSRNGGAWVMTPGWMCLDSSGNGTKGPWYWSSQTADETASGYMVWSNGLSTNTATHTWDVQAPSAAITSPGASPAPISFYGTADDPPNGAGFSSAWGSYCVTYFYDTTTFSYWWPGSGYVNSYPYNGPYCTISGMPSHHVTWNEGQIPPGFAHQSHHCYEWGVYVNQASPSRSNLAGWAKINFCVP